MGIPIVARLVLPGTIGPHRFVIYFYIFILKNIPLFRHRTLKRFRKEECRDVKCNVTLNHTRAVGKYSQRNVRHERHDRHTRLVRTRSRDAAERDTRIQSARTMITLLIN